MNLESMKADISEKERKQIIQQMTGQNFDGTVDYASFDIVAGNDIFDLNKREQAKEEILEYMLGQIKEEYKLSDNGEALLKWDEYKTKHGICLNKETPINRKAKQRKASKAALHIQTIDIANEHAEA